MTFQEIILEIKTIFTTPLFTINQSAVSLVSVITFFLIIIVFVQFAKLLKTKFLSKMLNKMNIEPGLQFNLIRITQYIIMFIGFMIALQFVGIDLSGLAVIFGFLSVGIGFGLQNIVSNFMAGLILLFERPIAVGDRVTVGNTEGDVENINIRSTTIRTLNNITYIVPNSEFVTAQVINWSHGDPKIRIDLDIGVSYNSDLDLVLNSLKEIAQENIEVLDFPKSEVHFKEFGDSSWNMLLRVWIMNPKRYYYIRSDLNCAVVRKFREKGIEIPFPQRDLHLRSPENLKIEKISKQN